jgi:hypothetical protein
MIARHPATPLLPARGPSNSARLVKSSTHQRLRDDYSRPQLELVREPATPVESVNLILPAALLSRTSELSTEHSGRRSGTQASHLRQHAAITHRPASSQGQSAPMCVAALCSRFYLGSAERARTAARSTVGGAAYRARDPSVPVGAAAPHAYDVSSSSARLWIEAQKTTARATAKCRRYPPQQQLRPPVRGYK